MTDDQHNTHGKGGDGPRPLSDEQIRTRKLSRRSIFGTLLAAGATGGCVSNAGPGGGIVLPASSGGVRPTGITDNDYAPVNGYTDPPNYGRGGGGRLPGGQIPTYSDQDSGPGADPYRQPRGTGLTDSDGGPLADPAGYGRRGW